MCRVVLNNYNDIVINSRVIIALCALLANRWKTQKAESGRQDRMTAYWIRLSSSLYTSIPWFSIVNNLSLSVDYLGRVYLPLPLHLMLSCFLPPVWKSFFRESYLHSNWGQTVSWAVQIDEDHRGKPCFVISAHMNTVYTVFRQIHMNIVSRPNF